MSDKIYVADRSNYVSGEWDNEPDKENWIDPETNYDCMIVRGPLGGLCGYVGIPESNPFFERDYDDVPVHTHGGLTYGSFCSGDICHSNERYKTYWLGFDCAHSGDMIPSRHMPRFGDEVYRNWAYVKNEVTDLARQLKALENEP